MPIPVHFYEADGHLLEFFHWLEFDSNSIENLQKLNFKLGIGGDLLEDQEFSLKNYKFQ
jgi:hypothetical protein